MEPNNYVRSMAYEAYIRLARRCDLEEFNAHNSYMQNLLDAEEGNKTTPYPYSKLFNDAKTAMIGATMYALRRHLAKEVSTKLQEYLKRIHQATTGNELLAICEEGEELF